MLQIVEDGIVKNFVVFFTLVSPKTERGKGPFVSSHILSLLYFIENGHFYFQALCSLSLLSNSFPSFFPKQHSFKKDERGDCAERKGSRNLTSLLTMAPFELLSETQEGRLANLIIVLNPECVSFEILSCIRRRETFGRYCRIILNLIFLTKFG